MAERVPIPSESDKLNWADGGSAYPSTDPGSAARSVGFKPKDYPTPGAGAIIPAEDHNWLWRVGMEMLSWLRDFVPREFDSVSEGIANVSVGQSFRVLMTTSGVIPQRLDQLLSVAGTGANGGDVDLVASDGEQVYYRSASAVADDNIVAADPADGSEVWEITPAGTITAMDADGSYVYYTADSGTPGLRIVDRSDGSAVATVGTKYDHAAIAANGGAYVVGVAYNGGAAYVVFYDMSGPSEAGTATPGAVTFVDVAIDHEQCYAVGTGNANDVFCWNLSSRAQQWEKPVDGNAFVPAAIATDGERLYIATDFATLSAGGSANLFCMDRKDGRVLWSAYAGSNDLEHIAVDDRYIYVVDSANQLYMLTKDSDAIQVRANKSNVGGPIAVDGCALYCQDAGTTTNLRALSTSQAPKLFQRVAGSSAYRRPFYNLAIPHSVG